MQEVLESNISESPEEILERLGSVDVPALRFGEDVFPAPGGHRNIDAVNEVTRQFGLTQDDFEDKLHSGEIERGFLTTDGLFLDRAEAFRSAKAENRLLPNSLSEEDELLYSEDLRPRA